MLLSLAPNAFPGITNITHSAENLTFTLVPVPCLEQKGQLQYYSVQHVEKIGTATCSHIDSQTQLLMDHHVAVSNLRPYTTYCFRVSRVNHKLLNGTYSGWEDIETAESGKPV